jgi:hypothetical protein
LGVARTIKIDDRRFHADRAAKNGFVSSFLKMLNEGGKIGSATEIDRKPLDGLPVGASDGGERAPFVRDESGFRRRLATRTGRPQVACRSRIK